ncbi:hypothetical protein ACSYDW_07150 [Paeniglutamicibacter sp. R2-26]|uniref:hypothetical protein n=1 Tax=Paeniglutamicibacter sp. R2-26 TaxID=3144417 RepID=UPI003EE7460B
MILTETLECTVPSPNAVKDAVIYCVTNPTNGPDISGSVADWAMVLITILLAALATLAWHEAKKSADAMEKQLHQMKTDSEAVAERAQQDFVAAEERSNDAIAAAAELESQREVDSSLFGYLSAHIDLFAASADPLKSLPEAQANLRKANLRFIMVYAFPGRSGEIINFDDLMMLLAEARREQLRIYPDGYEARELSFALDHGFNVVNNGLRDLYQGKLGALEFRERLPDTFAYLANQYGEHLPEAYMKKAKERGWLETPDLSNAWSTKD